MIIEKEKSLSLLSKIANELSKIAHKRSWFTKQERNDLDIALSILNNIIAKRIKDSQNIET